jgi:hypothetical protein
MSAHDFDSPWMTAAEGGLYIKRGKRFVMREIKSGRLRGAIVGGRRECMTRREWCDEWMEKQTVATPITASRRRLG